MHTPTVRGVVADRGSGIVGCAFVDLSRPAAGVGPVAVDPAVQSGGVGRRLMSAVMEWTRDRGIASVRLVQAAYNNASLCLYAKLGFVAREPLSVLSVTVRGPARATFDVRPARMEDVEPCGQLCRAVHGFERCGELEATIVGGSAMAVVDRGLLAGYTTGLGFAGHAVAKDNPSLVALIGAAPACAGPGFLLPTGNHDVLRWCLANGFRMVMQMTYMTTGSYSPPGGAWMPSILR